MGTSKKYWKGLDQLSENPEFVRKSKDEFAEPIPVEQFLGNEGLANSSTSRRDFLKYVGFSLTAATLAACEAPVIKTIPYVIKPEEVTPGIPDWYASTYYDGSDYCSVLVKTREGRPIKIEGNKLSSITKGGTNARVQASVLSLYDTARITAPYKSKAATTWESADKEISSKLADIVAKGGNIRILSATIISPSTKQVIADFITKYPTAKHVTYDAVSYSGIINANDTSFGQAIIPTYNFDKALTIVSIGADFLANWISPIEFSTQYVKNRKVSKEKKTMSKHIHFETIMSLTGANADKRVPVKISQQGIVVVNLYNAVAKLAGQPTLSSSSLPCDDQITAAAKKLFDTAGQSLVVCGSNDTDVQFIVNGINSMLKSYGNTIDISTPCYLRQGSDADFMALVSDMKSGKVGALITYNTNPVYTAPASIGFADAYKKVDLKISMADRLDETAQLADYVCPDNHYLESWNDASPREGVYSLAQPTIAPLFSKPRNEGTRCAQESLLMWAGTTTDYHTYIQAYWEKNIFPTQKKYTDFELFWIPTLRDGIYEATGVADESKNAMGDPVLTITNTKTGKTDKVTIDYSKSAQTIASAAKGGAFEAVLYEKVGIGNGNQANNPWLQELPDPISKVTWDNYITMNPSDMKDAKYNLLEEDDRQGSVATVSANGITVELPVYPQPGQAKGTIGMAVGYGRTDIGRVAEGVGANVFPFSQVINGTIQYSVQDVAIASVAGKSHLFATTQTHSTLVGRPIVKETTLEDYIKDPASGNEVEMVYTKEGKKMPTEVNLWTNFERLDHKWGLSIDLNSCIGCGACVVSCNAENNVPVVGKDEVSRSREMHWLRIDRYYSSDMTQERAEKENVGASNMVYAMEVPTTDNPEVVFQPMMCQHCNHAPCETVCPVMATNHSSEGLNQMIYNRCVGTRYCANNCPYKVRRFNWFNFSENPKFKDVNPSQDELGRMVLNPEVVVRSRGVMEKCSMCIQRIQGGKLKAKIERRPIKDGEIQTACSQSCPTNAISFGNMNDDNSEVANLGKDERMYHVLEELGVLPSVFYLTKVRNVDAVKEGA
ncbi:MAG: TAT-variant-translocated molybdopterin oxidoreductase [Bacteroidia bacterium]